MHVIDIKLLSVRLLTTSLCLGHFLVIALTIALIIGKRKSQENSKLSKSYHHHITIAFRSSPIDKSQIAEEAMKPISMALSR